MVESSCVRVVLRDGEGGMERDGVHRRAVEKERYKISFRDENGWRGGGGKVVVECGAEVWE